jgi:hypothetical protein
MLEWRYKHDIRRHCPHNDLLEQLAATSKESLSNKDPKQFLVF